MSHIFLRPIIIQEEDSSSLFPLYVAFKKPWPLLCGPAIYAFNAAAKLNAVFAVRQHRVNVIGSSCLFINLKHLREAHLELSRCTCLAY
jgi:hypothetical protein